MLEQRLKEKDYLPILKMNDGSEVTKENWSERRKELLAALETYSYGKTPEAPKKVYATMVKRTKEAFGGKVTEEQIRLYFETERGTCSFPVSLYLPNGVEHPPVILHLALKPVPDHYIPVEEIIDAGYALVVVCYQHLVNDNHYGDFSDGIGAHFGTTIHRKPDEWGKIGIWAYGACRVLDYLIEYRKDTLNVSRVAVIGHSRLGKTALWAAAQDERFWCAISNDSGYGGAASSKHGKGEKIRDFFRLGSWDLFCENFKEFVDMEDDKPYDQSWLLALIAPRYLCIGAAEEDWPADPEGEFLTALWASPAWELFGRKGLVAEEDRLPVAGDHFKQGCIGYHLRKWDHFLSREDWKHYLRFLDEKR